MYIVRTSLDDPGEADKMMRKVMTDLAAACCYISEVRSNYWWKGELREEKEFVLEFKVGEAGKMVNDLVSMIRTIHPYDLPVIEVIRVDVDPDVEEWANDPLDHTPQI